LIEDRKICNLSHEPGSSLRAVPGSTPNKPDYADFVTPTYDCYEYDEVYSSNMPYIDDVKSQDDVDLHDQYVGAQVRVPIGDEIRTGKVVWRKRELDRTVKGCANANSMADTRTYENEFPDGRSD
jgi:hypothetical protein